MLVKGIRWPLREPGEIRRVEGSRFHCARNQRTVSGVYLPFAMVEVCRAPAGKCLYNYVSRRNDEAVNAF